MLMYYVQNKNTATCGKVHFITAAFLHKRIIKICNPMPQGIRNMNFSDAAVIAIITGVFGFLALVPAYLINRRAARRDDFNAAQLANTKAFEALNKLYDEQSKRLDEVVADNKHYRTENARLLQRNEKLEDENRNLLKENTGLKGDVADLTKRVRVLEGKKA